MIRRYVIYYAVATAAVFCQCSCQLGEKRADASTGGAPVAATPLELPLPDVPSALTVPHLRADYVMEHFWDKMDFSDTLRSRNRQFMEMNLVNYMSLFPHGSKQAVARSIGKLIGSTANDSAAFRLTTELLEQYLDEPDSPMRNEDFYILYLEQLLKLPGLSEAEHMRYASRLETANKNRPGTPATDFAYIDRKNRRRTLGNTPGNHILLIFYDPECSHCSTILEQVDRSPVVKNRIAKKELTVLAVYTEGNRTLWNETRHSMPQDWTVGFDTDSIVMRELYSIPAMPVMYLLDNDKKVLLKDAFLPEIEECLNKIPPEIY